MLAPEILKDLPAYFQTKELPSQSGLSNSTNRQLNEAARMEARSETFLKTDVIEKFDDLMAEIDDEIQRQEYFNATHPARSKFSPRHKRIPTFNFGSHIGEKQGERFSASTACSCIMLCSHYDIQRSDSAV